MFIVMFCANRGTNGLWNRTLVEWAENVTCDKEEIILYPDGKKTYRYKIKCFHEAHEKYDDAPVHIVSPLEHGDYWEHFYIKHAKTGEIFTPSGFNGKGYWD